MHRLLRSAASLLALSLSFIAGCDRGDHPRQVGAKAPDFPVTLGSRELHLSDYRGKVVLLNFWATWCAPCIEELPSLTQLEKTMPGVTVLTVSTDVNAADYKQNEDDASYHQLLSEHRLPQLAAQDAACRSNALYGTYRFPESYVIDRKGIIRRKFIGPQNWTSPEILEYLSHL